MVVRVDNDEEAHPNGLTTEQKDDLSIIEEEEEEEHGKATAA